MDVFPEICLSDYKFIKKIGEGNFGKVYLIEHSEESKRYAAKESNEILNDESSAATFFKEINSYSKINNPAILTLYGYSSTNFNGDPYPVMLTDYMPNGSLGDMLKKERRGLADHDFTITKKYIILLGIALGMKLLHYKNIVHRDLKPDNILLDENFNPKISDFGCSCISADGIFDFLLNSEEGTPAYMAPEIFKGEYFTYKIDIYSFALIAYELITGNKPFSEYSKAFNLVNDVMNGKRPDVNGLNPNIQSFLSKCWDDDHSKRPTFGQIVDEMMQPEFKEALGILDDEEIDNYLDLFDDSLLNPKQMDCLNLKEEKDKLRSLHSESKLPENGRWMEKKEIIDLYRQYSSKTPDPKMKIMFAAELNTSGDPNDQKQSAQILKKYAEEKNVIAMHHCVEALRYGYGVQKDLKKAAQLMKMAADLGDRLSMAKYSDMLHDGVGVPVNPKEAVRYAKMAADKGQLNSIYKYATSLFWGYGVEKNIDESIKYLRIAASRSHPEAMAFLGKLIIKGVVKNANMSEGCKCIIKSAELGCSESMFMYGLMLRDGTLVKKNIEESNKYIKKAAEKGDPFAMREYAFGLYNGTPFKQNKLEAVKYFKILIDQNKENIDFDVMKTYAFMQLAGDGVPINRKEGAKYCKILAEKFNNPMIMHVYGSMLFYGDGIAQNSSYINGTFFKLQKLKSW